MPAPIADVTLSCITPPPRVRARSNVVADLRLDRWRDPQSPVNPTEVVVREVQAEGSPQILPLFAEGIRQTGEPPNLHPHGQVPALNVRSANAARIEMPEKRNLKAMLALYFCWYNFYWVHSTLRVTSAMAAGVMDRLWEVSDLVALLEAEEWELERAA